MTRCESSAWSLAGGSACVFALAVVLGHLPWETGFLAVGVAVVAWAWPAPPAAGAALGAVGWLCVTGFDLHAYGNIEVTGLGDAGRAAVLVLGGVLAAAVHRVVEARRGHRRADPLWGDLHEAVLGWNETSGDVTGRLAVGVARPRGPVPVERPFSINPKEGRADG